MAKYGELDIRLDLNRDVLVITTGGAATILTDEAQADPTTELTKVQRVVVAARLRAWAEHIEKGGAT